MATSKKIRRTVILAAIETTKGTDAVPTAANAMEIRNAVVTPIDGDEVQNDFLRPHFGSSGSVLVTEYARVSFEVPFSGVAALGDMPGYAALLRACAASVTTDAGVSVTFAPVTDDIESVTIYTVIDKVRHKMTGAHGNAKATVDAKGIPVWQFEFTGGFKPAEDVAMPAVDYSAFLPSLPVNKSNTTLTLHGVAVACSAFSFDFGNTVVKQDLINVDDTEITGRNSTGSVTIRNTSVADKDWVSAVRAGTRGALALRHGQGANNVVEISATRVQLGKPTYSEQDGIQMIQLPLSFIPSDAGNDEWAIKVY